jgi:hypothetical protein
MHFPKQDGTMITTFGGVVLIALGGMALVLAAILVFWAFLSGLVWLAGAREGDEAASGAEARTAPDGLDASEVELRRRAALAAVAVALAREVGEVPGPFPMPPLPLVSTWQSVNRARLLGRRGAVR